MDVRLKCASEPLAAPPTTRGGGRDDRALRRPLSPRRSSPAGAGPDAGGGRTPRRHGHRLPRLPRAQPGRTQDRSVASTRGRARDNHPASAQAAMSIGRPGLDAPARIRVSTCSAERSARPTWPGAASAASSSSLRRDRSRCRSTSASWTATSCSAPDADGARSPAAAGSHGELRGRPDRRGDERRRGACWSPGAARRVDDPAELDRLAQLGVEPWAGGQPRG